MNERRPIRPRRAVALPVWLVLSGGLLLLIGSGYWLFNVVQRMAADVPIVAQPDFDEVPLTVAEGGRDINPIPYSATVEFSEQAAVEGGPVAVLPESGWSGTERVTLLLLGVDRRCGETGPVRTDSLMLVTIDPVGKTAGMLSLPRDLWVEIPGFNEADRINRAHFLGEGFEYPGGGPALTVDTVETLLGININYYAAVNFEAFTQAIDLLGGLTIDVNQTIDDPTYPDECYGFDPFYLEAGTHTLDGSTALKYARTRVTTGGDIDRANRQQQVVLAARDQAISNIPELLLRAPQMWQNLSDNVVTTMSLEEATQLALLLPEIPRENIRKSVIDYNYVYEGQTPEGDFILIPRRENIRALRDELFAAPAAPAVEIDNLVDLVRDEEARVGVYNGTQTFGLAGQTQSYLVENGINVTVIGNADDSQYPTTRIIRYADQPYTLEYLVSLLKMPPLNVTTGDEPLEDVDLLVILGADWQVPDD